VNTCFAILLGDISVNDDLNQLQGLQGVAATLFFWSFELLVFMVLLNFLLAIIVDAFSEVKENTHETTGISNPLPSSVPRMGSSCRSVSCLLTFPLKSSFGDVNDQQQTTVSACASLLARDVHKQGKQVAGTPSYHLTQVCRCTTETPRTTRG